MPSRIQITPAESLRSDSIESRYNSTKSGSESDLAIACSGKVPYVGPRSSGVGSDHYYRVSEGGPCKISDNYRTFLSITVSFYRVRMSADFHSENENGLA
jgi:hypothetical protein